MSALIYLLASTFEHVSAFYGGQMYAYFQRIASLKLMRKYLSRDVWDSEQLKSEDDKQKQKNYRTIINNCEIIITVRIMKKAKNNGLR